MEHFVVICEYCVDGESGADIISVDHSYKEAMNSFKSQLNIETANAKKNGFDSCAISNDYFYSFLQDDSCMNHIKLCIEHVVKKSES